MEQELKQPDIAEQFHALLELDPKIITNYVPADAAAQKSAYLKGEITQPHHNYARLNVLDLETKRAEIDRVGDELLHNPAMKPKFAAGYQEFIQRYTQQATFLEKARAYNTATNDEEKQQAAREYMELNVELYGEPDQQTYRSLIGEKLAAIRAKDLTGTAKELADELFAMVESDGEAFPERFKPSQETIDWVHEVVTSLYADMLRHLPEQKEFTAAEIKSVFEEIIHEEFGEAAEGWTVDVEEAKAINVKASEKRIVIPADAVRSYEVMRGLIVHELGVHLMRAITGAETDFDPLSTGLSEYYDAEEGMGKVAEQGLNREFREAGVDYYIASGLAYFDDKNFDDIVNIQWRLSLLGGLKAGEDVTDEAIEKKRAAAYNSTYRVMRGTDELPWFKDLAYYNGTMEMWKHLENIRGDDIKFMFVLMGKANPANIAHERLMYETQSK